MNEEEILSYIDKNISEFKCCYHQGLWYVVFHNDSTAMVSHENLTESLYLAVMQEVK